MPDETAETINNIKRKVTTPLLTEALIEEMTSKWLSLQTPSPARIP